MLRFIDWYRWSVFLPDLATLDYCHVYSINLPNTVLKFLEYSLNTTYLWFFAFIGLLDVNICDWHSHCLYQTMKWSQTSHMSQLAPLQSPIVFCARIVDIFLSDQLNVHYIQVLVFWNYITIEQHVNITSTSIISHRGWSTHMYTLSELQAPVLQSHVWAGLWTSLTKSCTRLTKHLYPTALVVDFIFQNGPHTSHVNRPTKLTKSCTGYNSLFGKEGFLFLRISPKHWKTGIF